MKHYLIVFIATDRRTRGYVTANCEGYQAWPWRVGDAAAHARLIAQNNPEYSDIVVTNVIPIDPAPLGSEASA